MTPHEEIDMMLSQLSEVIHQINKEDIRDAHTQVKILVDLDFFQSICRSFLYEHGVLKEIARDAYQVGGCDLVLVRRVDGPGGYQITRVVKWCEDQRRSVN